MSFGKKLQNNLKKFVAPEMIKQIDGKKDVFSKLFVTAYTENSDEEIAELMKKGHIDLYEFVRDTELPTIEKDGRKLDLEELKTKYFDKYGNPYGPLKGVIAELLFDSANPYEKHFHIGVGANAVQLAGIKKIEKNGNYVFRARLYVPQLNEQTKEVEFIKTSQFGTSIWIDGDRFDKILKKIQDVFMDIDLKKNLELPEEERQSHDVILCSLGNPKITKGEYTNYSLNVYDVIVHADLN